MTYKLLISRLRANYGDVPILCISPAITQRQIVQYMERMRKDLNDKKVYIAVLRRPLRSDYRPRSSMASKLQRSNENGYVIDSLYVNYHRMAIEKGIVLLRLTMYIIIKMAFCHFDNL